MGKGPDSTTTCLTPKQFVKTTLNNFQTYGGQLQFPVSSINPILPSAHSQGGGVGVGVGVAVGVGVGEVVVLPVVPVLVTVVLPVVGVPVVVGGGVVGHPQAG